MLGFVVPTSLPNPTDEHTLTLLADIDETLIKACLPVTHKAGAHKSMSAAKQSKE
jgi:hypothetical protein